MSTVMWTWKTNSYKSKSEGYGPKWDAWGRIFVHIYRGFLIGRDGHLDQSEAYDKRNLYEDAGPGAYLKLELHNFA